MVGGQRYVRVPANEADTTQSPSSPYPSNIPNSPPPSFRSRNSSPASRRHLSRRSTGSDVSPTLEDTFDVGASDDGEDEGDDRQRLMRGNASISTNVHASNTNERIAETGTARRPVMANTGSRAANPAVTSSFSLPQNDGVFANLNAKPEHGEKLEEQPPSYEQAAADATPPYWETTIMAPGMVSDEVFIDGLPVGSFFSFAWNGIISMAFQLVGFLLTYLLHTTHAAKNGSRAGLGITLINYGFTMKAYSNQSSGGSGPQYGQPTDPNSHDFDPSAVSDSTMSGVTSSGTEAQDRAPGSYPASAWFAYVLLVAGWIVLIKSVSDFVKARRHEQLILQSPDRGLNVPVVAEGENMEAVV